MAVGDVRLFKAAISGFAPTSTNPATAGWTQLTGTADLGQSATHLLVIDNGLERIIIDKNIAATAAITFYGYDGSTWQLLGGNNALSGLSPTVSSISKNTAKLAEVNLSFVNDAAETTTVAISLARGMPVCAIRFNTTGGAGGNWDLGITRNGTPNTWLYQVAAGVTGDDRFGFVTESAYTPSGNNFFVSPMPGLNLDFLLAYSHDEPVTTSRASPFTAGYDALVAGDLPTRLFVGFMPRTYGVGDGGGANVGNGANGQLREAEDNYTAVGGASLSVQTDSDCSNSKRIDFATPASGHKARYSINFPSPGVYYVLAASNCDGSSATARAVVDGTNGSTVALANGGFNLESAHVLHGPFTITTAGNKVVDFEVVAVGTATVIRLDHLSIFPYEATASTPATQIFPRNLAQSLLRLVTPT